MAIDDSKLLYKPFELQSKWRKVSQIKLHGEVQGKLKAEFNQKHKALLNFKRGELEKSKEKQERIGEIEEELSRLNSEIKQMREQRRRTAWQSLGATMREFARALQAGSAEAAFLQQHPLLMNL